MSYRIEFTQEVQRVIKKWKKSNPTHFKNFIGFFRNWKLILALELGIPNRSKVVEVLLTLGDCQVAIE